MRPDTKSGLAVLAALACAVASFFLLPAHDARIWPGRVVLLVDSSLPEKEILSRLARAGLSKVLCESTQPVQVSNFGSMETISLADCAHRLVEGDARLDSYIEGLRFWYRAKAGGLECRIYYIGETAAGGTSARITRAMSGLDAGWFLPEVGFSAKEGFPVRLAVLYAIILSVFIVSTKGAKQRLLVLSLGLALCPLIQGGEAAAALAGLLLAALADSIDALELFFGEMRLSGRFWSALRDLGKRLAARIHLFLPIIGLAAFEPRLALSASAAFCASLFGYSAVWSLLYARGRARPPFVPLTIVRKARPEWLSFSKRASSYLACGSSASFVLVFVLSAYSPVIHEPVGSGKPGPSLGAAILPLPVVQAGPARPSPAEALRLSSARRDDELVDLADWLVHRWREEALFYVPLGEKNESPFSPIVLPSPDQSDKVLKTFDSAWAEAAWRSMARTGIEGLLLSRGGFTRGRIGPLSADASPPLAPTRPLLYIILLAPPLVGAYLLGTRRITCRRERTHTS